MRLEANEFRQQHLSHVRDEVAELERDAARQALTRASVRPKRTSKSSFIDELDHRVVELLRVLRHEQMTAGQLLERRAGNALGNQPGILRHDEAIFATGYDHGGNVNLAETRARIEGAGRRDLTRQRERRNRILRADASVFLDDLGMVFDGVVAEDRL